MGQVASLPNGSVSLAKPTFDQFHPQVDIWVQLRNQLSAYSYDKALLICELEEDAWIAWVPDYGEVLLQRSDFYRIEVD